MKLYKRIAERFSLNSILLIMGAVSAAAVVIYIAASGLHNGKVIYPAEEVSLDFELVETEGGSIWLRMDESAQESDGKVYEHMLININKASAEELMLLPGIGQVLADAIVEYREINGDFMAVSELMEVKGVGEGLYSKICMYCTVEGDPIQYNEYGAD